MTAALSISGLKKTYKGGHIALKGIDLAVEAGDFYALLGPNGAGKTTAIGIISSLVNKTSGKVEIFGHDIDTDLEAAKTCIGLVPQELNMNLFHEQTVQSWFLPYEWFIQFWNTYYGTAHFIVTLAVFVLLYKRRADVFPQWRNSLAAMTALGPSIRPTV